MSKRGGILDFIYIPIILFIIGICLMVALFINEKVDESGIFADYAEAQKVNDQAHFTLLSMDNMMLFVLIGISLFVLISAALVYNHPAFLIVSMFMLMMAVIISATMSNTFWKFTVVDAMVPVSAQLPKLTFIMQNIPIYLAFMGFATLSLMYISIKRET